MKVLGLLLITCVLVVEGNFPTFQGVQYLVEHDRSVTSYAWAEMECKMLNATLAAVKTTGIRNFLRNYTNPKGYPFLFYIGAKRVGKTDQFRWEDGSRVRKSIWHKNEPNNLIGDENCVAMSTAEAKEKLFKLMDIPCDTTARYICEKKSTNKNSNSTTTSKPVLTTSTTKPTTTLPTSSTDGATVNMNVTIISLASCGSLVFIICVVMEKASVVLLPCGHIACCRKCGADVKFCPVCKRRVGETILSYIV